MCALRLENTRNKFSKAFEHKVNVKKLKTSVISLWTMYYKDISVVYNENVYALDKNHHF